MTTFNFRVPKGTSNLPEQASNIVKATTGTDPNLDGSRITVVDEADGDANTIAFDYAPKNKAVRGGTIGTGRGSMRGVR